MGNPKNRFFRDDSHLLQGLFTPVFTSRYQWFKVNRGSYKSAHVLLNLLNELRKKIKCEACRAFYLLCNEFNKFNNIGA